jgi:carboxyl-terminal processing protease
MRIGRILGNTVGTVALLGVAFVGGVTFNDLRSVHSAEALRTVAELMPQRLSEAVMTAAHGQSEDYTPYQTYADVLATLKAGYYGKPIDSTQMTYNGIRGMMGATHDRFTRFMDPKAYKEMEEENQGSFVGIGALLGTNKAQQVYIVKPLPGGPAIKAKVLSGDIILKVSGKPTLGLKDSEVVKLIRGTEGTRVTLTLLRKGAPHPVTISMIRATVRQEVVEYSMIDPVRKIGYVKLSVFNEESDVELGTALAALEAQGMRGLVFDLRENPGGLLEIAQKVASRFIPDGPVLWIKDKSETSETMEHLDVDPTQHLNHLHYPLVVLVNGNSASAAEIVSGAIKDTGSGILVGEKTYGKGIVQTIMGLPDGSAVAITTQHYYTARKNDIHHKGIEPDIKVAIPDANQRKEATFYRDHPDAYYDLKYDTQLQTALAQEKQQMQVAKARPW